MLDLDYGCAACYVMNTIISWNMVASVVGVGHHHPTCFPVSVCLALSCERLFRNTNIYYETLLKSIYYIIKSKLKSHVVSFSDTRNSHIN
jgi:hypothetical protein